MSRSTETGAGRCSQWYANTAANPLAQITAMGVRLYNPHHRPLPGRRPGCGGSCNDYDYTCADPSTSATIVRAERPSAPEVDRFEPVRASPPAPVHARPCGGLWTSTALGGAVSPWSLWREVGAESSSFVGAPTVWRLGPRPGAAVHEIAGAADWTALISTFPATTSVGVLPDWLAVAEAYDGVHFTMTAAVALQGTSYRLPDGSRTVPMYVDVESTIWLRWVFSVAVDVPATAQVRSPPE